MPSISLNWPFCCPCGIRPFSRFRLTARVFTALCIALILENTLGHLWHDWASSQIIWFLTRQGSHSPVLSTQRRQLGWIQDGYSIWSMVSVEWAQYITELCSVLINALLCSDSKSAIKTGGELLTVRAICYGAQLIWNLWQFSISLLPAVLARCPKCSHALAFRCCNRVL